MSDENKIITLSRVLRIFALISLGAVPLIDISFWAIHSFSIPSLPSFIMRFIPYEITPQIPPLSEMNAFIKLIGFIAYFTPMILTMIALGMLARLFKYYQNLQVFSQGAIGCIRNLGYILLAGPFLSIIYFFLIAFFLPSSFPISSKLMTGVFLGSLGYSLRTIAEALCIILISWIMKKANKIQEEQEYTV